MSAFDFAFVGIDGKPLPMADFARRPVLVVNTASRCGHTPQYADLQALWASRRNRGLVVLGVPSNDFGGQEPSSDDEIYAFCTASFGIDFPMTGKQTVIGGGAHPFYRWIVDEIGEAAAPKWNFHKYLIGPDGALAALWPPDVGPLNPEIVDAIDALLGNRCS